MITLEQAKNYIREDCDDEDVITSIKDAMEVSQVYIDSMVGEAYKEDKKAIKLADLLQKKLIADMYENRSTEVPQNTKQDRIVTSILDKLSNFEV
ncbi:head-tail connector protein [Clostridium botulinum]|uniref:head-tail connector protein n=1 Tax=Clostridium botulinum TaxID=1491 RepID=UPI0021BFF393|nr:head-tail connector protein [Clostridium botulinum]